MTDIAQYCLCSAGESPSGHQPGEDGTEGVEDEAAEDEAAVDEPAVDEPSIAEPDPQGEICVLMYW